MNTNIRDLITTLQIIIPFAAAPRAVQCLGMIARDADQAPNYKKRLLNILVFIVIAECAVELIYLISAYF